jgi:hypothetical protein
MRILRRLGDAGRLIVLWPVLAITTAAVMLSVPPPLDPRCPSVLDAATPDGPGMGRLFYDCRTVGAETDGTIRWAFIAVLLGLGVLVAGYSLEGRRRKERRS